MSDELNVELDRRAFHQEVADYVKQLSAELSALPDNRLDLINILASIRLQIDERKRVLSYAVDEAEVHYVKSEINRYELAMANLSERLRACPEPEEPPKEAMTDPVALTSASPHQAPTLIDDRRAKIRAYKSRHKLKTYGDVAHHINERWNHRTVIDKFIGHTGRPEDDKTILNALAKNALI